MGRHTGRTQPHPPRRHHHLHHSRRPSRRFHPLSPRRPRRLTLDWHSPRPRPPYSRLQPSHRYLHPGHWTRQRSRRRYGTRHKWQPLGCNSRRPLPPRRWPRAFHHQLHLRQRPFQQRHHRTPPALQRNPPHRHPGPRVESLGWTPFLPSRAHRAQPYHHPRHPRRQPGVPSDRSWSPGWKRRPPLVRHRQRHRTLQLRHERRLFPLDGVRPRRWPAHSADGHQ
jgi:hypothetical protein